MITFLVGFIIGAFAGLMLAAILWVNGRDD